MVFPSKSLWIELLTYIPVNDIDEFAAQSALFFSVLAISLLVPGHLPSLELDSTAQAFMGAADNGELTILFKVHLGTQREKKVEVSQLLKSLLSKSISVWLEKWSCLKTVKDTSRRNLGKLKTKAIERACLALDR